MPTVPSLRTLRARRASNASIYRRRLKPDHIRVLDLHPSSDSSSPVECDLTIVDLHAASTNYRAVSYCWGNEPFNDCVKINGKPFWVRPNLARLLSELRHEHDNRTLWVDAISINQENVEERNAQVQMMWKIYSRAIEVFIWLGEEVSGPSQINTHDNSTESIRYTASQAAKKLSEFDEAAAQLPQSDHFVQSVKWLLGHPHFGRQWMIPEAALAQDITFFCGNNTFSLDTLALVFGTAGSTTSVASQQFQKYRRCLADQFCSLQRTTTSEERRQRLRDLLLRFRWNDCTDARDKVFALLSTCRVAQEQITIDYRNSTETVLVEVLDYVTHSEELRPRESMHFAQIMVRVLRLDDFTDPVRLSGSTLSGRIDYSTRQFFQTQLVHVATVTQPAVGLSTKAHKLLETMSGQRLRTFTPTELTDVTERVAGSCGTGQNERYLELVGPHAYSGTISPQDLRPFTWRPFSTHSLETRDQQRLGLATVEVHPGHLVCVLRGTTTALIVEKQRLHDYKIIGRAVIRVVPGTRIEGEPATVQVGPGSWSEVVESAESVTDHGEAILVTARGADTLSLLQLSDPLDKSTLDPARISITQASDN